MAPYQAEQQRPASVPQPAPYRLPAVTVLGRLEDLTGGRNYGELGPRPHKFF
jgi:hypothetical protein